ncbi:hypothetical protein ALC53_01669 [Atta colombica]|uniref:Uncharacterized protein n=1 Tax=Atta colombica TaxID=520822 RepID=A0A195BUL6_9HYME|nr:hypothetical protein ALC53_01669 [Atta colombica]
MGYVSFDAYSALGIISFLLANVKQGQMIFISIVNVTWNAAMISSSDSYVFTIFNNEIKCTGILA